MKTPIQINPGINPAVICRLGVLIVLLGFAHRLHAQNPKEEISVASVKGVFCVDNGTKKSVASIKIKVPAYTPDVIQFKIEWESGKAEVKPVNIPKTDKDLEFVYDHEFDLSDCMYDREFLIKVTSSFAPESKKTDWRAPTSVYFTNPPQAVILPSPSPACVGQKVNFGIRFCPNESVSSRINFGDGSPEESKTNHDYAHTYATIGTYNGFLQASNVCNAGNPIRTPFSVTVIDRAVPVLADSGATRAINKDTSLVCLTNGKAIIRLDGTKSSGATRYFWSGSGIRYIGNTNSTSPRPLVEFTSAGTYTVYLEVDNPCEQRSAKIPKVYKVLALPQLTLAQPADACRPILFTIKDRIAEATYTINDTLPVPLAGVNLGFSSKPYVVKASLSNECTNNAPVTLERTFTIKPVEPVKILFPRDTTVCVGSVPIVLRANIPGGNWLPDSVFRPTQVGSFEVNYVRGTGTCAARDSIKINVSGADVTAQNQTVCGTATFVKLGGLPTGGRWTALDCPECVVKGDTLVLSGLTKTQVSMQYNVTGGNGCPGQRIIQVNLSRPKIVRLEIKGGCEGKSTDLTVEVTGTTVYRWYLNGNTSPFSTAARPTLTLVPGRNTIRLEVGSPDCGDVATREVVISMPPQPFKVSKKSNPSNNCGPVLVELMADGDQRSDLTYSWTQDGREFSTNFQPSAITLTNTSADNKRVWFKLIQANACGKESDSIAVDVLARAMAKIGVDSTEYRCGPANVLLTDLSVKGIGVKTWLIDGKTVTSNQDRISITLPAKGDSITTYRIGLVVSNACNSDTSYVQIRVYPSRIKPAFNMSASEVCVGEKIKLTDVTPAAALYGQSIWKFLDGQNLAGRTVERSFSRPGTYRIRLLVKLGCIVDSTDKLVVVTALPPILGRLLTTTACQGQPVQLQYDGSNSFLWTPQGLGQDSSQFKPSFVFSTEGVKTIGLTVYGNTKACKADTMFRATIRPVPKVRAISTPGFACSGAPLTLTAEMEREATDYKWTFISDGRITSVGSKSPSVVLQKGTYDVRLTAYEGGCADSSFYKLSHFTVDSCAIGIPEIFTPNQDPYSSHFTIFGDRGVSRIVYLKIFDRWGKLIFFGKDLMPNKLEQGWNGKDFQGIDMPEGVYPYQAQIELMGTETPIPKTGLVRLVR